jgi:uncharacterized membrane protein YfcA
MRRFARPDPLIVLVGGVIIVCGALGVFAMLKLTPDQIAQLEAGVIMIVSGIRMWLSRTPAKPFDDRAVPIPQPPPDQQPPPRSPIPGDSDGG